MLSVDILKSTFTQNIFYFGIVLSQETILFRILLIRVDQSLVFFDENNERPFLGDPITL